MTDTTTTAQKRPLTRWQMVKGCFGHSVTILAMRAMLLVGVLSTVSDAMQQIIPANYWPYYVIAIALIGEMCRWRTATFRKDGDNDDVAS